MPYIFLNENILKSYIKIFVFSMGWYLKHDFLLGISVYKFLSTCYYIICVC